VRTVSEAPTTTKHHRQSLEEGPDGAPQQVMNWERGTIAGTSMATKPWEDFLKWKREQAEKAQLSLRPNEAPHHQSSDVNTVFEEHIIPSEHYEHH
ncbi:MAG: hypothetical protein ACK56F_13160, partial [bacterium]